MDGSNVVAVQQMVHASRLFRLMDGSADIGGERIVKEGSMVKQGAIHKTWKTRWFSVTASGCVLYFKSQKAFPLGGFILHRATVLLSDSELIVKSPVSYTMSKGQAEEAKDRVFKMRAKDLNELRSWEAVLVNVQAGHMEGPVGQPQPAPATTDARPVEDAPATLVSPPISPRGSPRQQPVRPPPPPSPRGQSVVPKVPALQKAAPPTSPRERPTPPPRKSGAASPVASPRRTEAAVPDEVATLQQALLSLQARFAAASDAELAEGTGDSLFSALAHLRDLMLPLHNRYRSEGYMASSVQLWRTLNDDIPARINRIKTKRAAAKELEAGTESEVSVLTTTAPGWSSEEEGE